MLFFGHETTLQIFQILVIAVVDLAAKNFILAGVIAYIVDLILCKIRDGLGQNNIAKKTMVDDRFLI